MNLIPTMSCMFIFSLQSIARVHKPKDYWTILSLQWQVKSKSKERLQRLITNTRTHLHVLEGIKQLYGSGMNAALTCANLMWRIMQKLPKCVQPLTRGCLLQLPGHRVISSLWSWGIFRWYVYVCVCISIHLFRIKAVISHSSILIHSSAFATILILKQLPVGPKYKVSTINFSQSQSECTADYLICTQTSTL